MNRRRRKERRRHRRGRGRGREERQTTVTEGLRGDTRRRGGPVQVGVDDRTTASIAGDQFGQGRPPEPRRARKRGGGRAGGGGGKVGVGGLVEQQETPPGRGGISAETTGLLGHRDEVVPAGEDDDEVKGHVQPVTGGGGGQEDPMSLPVTKARQGGLTVHGAAVVKGPPVLFGEGVSRHLGRHKHQHRARDTVGFLTEAAGEVGGGGDHGDLPRQARDVGGRFDDGDRGGRDVGETVERTADVERQCGGHEDAGDAGEIKGHGGLPLTKGPATLTPLRFGHDEVSLVPEHTGQSVLAVEAAHERPVGAGQRPLHDDQDDGDFGGLVRVKQAGVDALATKAGEQVVLETAVRQHDHGHLPGCQESGYLDHHALPGAGGETQHDVRREGGVGDGTERGLLGG